uniref:Hook microtubule-tethering protein 1 n=1 Tax=Salmo trutta TaxID=8032 RepID=A0A674EWQ4_SALTR
MSQCLPPSLQTFNTGSPCTAVAELTTGVAMSQALHQIDPAWFSKSWLGRIKEDVGDNWRLKVLNSILISFCPSIFSPSPSSSMTSIPNSLAILPRYVPSSIHSFFPSLTDLKTRVTALCCCYILYLVKVAEHSDPVELGRLLQLILGCAVKCERKQEYIQVIMTLEESVQHVVMTAIQELMSKENMAQFGAEPPGDVESQLKKALEDLADLMSEKEELAQRCHELDVQVTVLQEERNSLLAENDVLTDRANQLDAFDDPSTPSGRKHSQLQIQLETLQEENFRLEAAKDDYRIHCEELEKQLIEVQHRNDELTSLAEESRALKDELDILRSCSDRAVKLEASVETYRRKLEDLGDLRRQVKLLEEKNMTYMHNTVSLEEELRKANTARAQLETYKRQVQELHRKLSEESRRADNLAYEMKKFEEKYDAVMKEKEVRTGSQHFLLQPTCTGNHLIIVFVCESLTALIVCPCPYREKFIRLQHENKMLRVQQEGSENDKISDLQTLLEEAHRTRSELDTENRLNRERVTELQQQVEDLQKSLQGQGAKTDDSHLKRKLDAHMVQLNEAQDEIMKKKELLEDLQPDNTQTSLRMEELMAALKKKDDDMRAMEERYKMYLEKARNVIRALDPKLNPATAEIQALKNQLMDRDKRILSLEVTLTFNPWPLSLTLSQEKLAIEARLGGRSTSMVPPGQSFLSQQRQVTNTTRRTLSVSVPATTAN